MQERIAQLDDALIDRVCQPLVNRMAAGASVDCYRLARLCNDAAALVWLLSRMGCISDALASGNVGLAGAQSALVLIGLGALLTLRRVFEGRSGGARANPLRPAMFLHRVACLLWLGVLLLGSLSGPGGLMELLTIGVALMMTASVYVGACSSPPPQRRSSRMRAWQHALAR